MKYKHVKIIKKNYLRHISTENIYFSAEEMDLCYLLASIVANHVNKRELLKLRDHIEVKQKIRIGGKLRIFYSKMGPFSLYIRFGSISSYFEIIWPENEA